MIEGVVNAAHEAVVPLSLRGPAGQARDIEAVVDTGYDGSLILPGTLVTELGLPFAHSSRVFLANDAEVRLAVHLVTVLWDGQPRQIMADVTGSAPLVGMELLAGHDLSIEVEPGGRVLIEARG